MGVLAAIYCSRRVVSKSRLSHSIRDSFTRARVVYTAAVASRFPCLAGMRTMIHPIPKLYTDADGVTLLVQCPAQSIRIHSPGASR